MVSEIEVLASLGVSGIVLGVLDSEGRIDRGVLTDLVDAAGGLPVTFHRAFDELEDAEGGLVTLMEAGVARVLTSGGAPTAWEGRETLRTFVQQSPPGLTVLGGGRVRGDHVHRLLRETGLREIHARASAIPEIMEALRSVDLSSHLGNKAG
jgi:copper homeostasis protein